MGSGNDVNYWNLIFIGAMLLGAVIFWAMMRNRKSTVDPQITEEGTHRVYEEEQRIHRKDPGSGL
jgi:hypothetical protein